MGMRSGGVDPYLVSAVASGVGGRAMLAAGGAVVATSVHVGSRPVVNLEFEIRVVQQSKKKINYHNDLVKCLNNAAIK
jgi:hypothetical protein